MRVPFFFSILFLCVLGGPTKLASAPSEYVQLRAQNGDLVLGEFYPTTSLGKAPTIFMLHGCGGLWRDDGTLGSRFKLWRDLFLEQGYHVFLLDSFTGRNAASQCKVKNHERVARANVERPQDVLLGLGWLKNDQRVDPQKIVLGGWSNGAMTMLWTMANKQSEPGAFFKAAFGFYPGCKKILREKPHYKPSIETLLLLAKEDNWTYAAPCERLVRDSNKNGVARMSVVTFPGAYHGFDNPDMPLREITVAGGRKVFLGSNEQARIRAQQHILQFLSVVLE